MVIRFLVDLYQIKTDSIINQRTKKMKYLFSATILFVLIQNSFSQSNKNIDGYWLQEGYGAYLEVSDSVYKMYDITKMSCQTSSSMSLNNWTGSLNTLLDLYNIEKLTSESLILKYGITSYKFNRLKEPLKHCETPISFSEDPELNFDIFWYTFKENYAYSSLRGVNWDDIYKNYSPRVSKNTSREELYSYFREILDSINDGHISLRVPNELRNSYDKKSIKKTVLKENKQEEFEYNYPTAREKSMKNILDLYPNVAFKSYHKDLIIWGKLNERVGYIQMNSINGFSPDVSISDSLKASVYWEKHWEKIFKDIEDGKTLGAYLRGELKGANAVMDTIMTEFYNLSSIIIDLRFNPGGTDQVALDILSHFTNKKIKIFTKKIWTGASSTFESEVFIKPSLKSYEGKVILLTGPQTGSSAETLIMGSFELPNMIRVGSNTMGIFSDVLQKKLPNGWRFGLSNEIYETEDGENYEYQGIPPNFLIPYPREWRPFYKAIIELKDFDPAIEKAISLTSK